MTILQLKMLNSLKSKLSLVMTPTIFCAIRICKKTNSNKQTKQNIFSFLLDVLIRRPLIMETSDSYYWLHRLF